MALGSTGLSLAKHQHLMAFSDLCITLQTVNRHCQTTSECLNLPPNTGAFPVLHADGAAAGDLLRGLLRFRARGRCQWRRDVQGAQDAARANFHSDDDHRWRHLVLPRRGGGDCGGGGVGGHRRRHRADHLLLLLLRRRSPSQRRKKQEWLLVLQLWKEETGE